MDLILIFNVHKSEVQDKHSTELSFLFYADRKLYKQNRLHGKSIKSYYRIIGLYHYSVHNDNKTASSILR